MEVIVTGRHFEVSDRFRGHVAEKLLRLEKHDHRIQRVNAEVEPVGTARSNDAGVRVQLTALSKGPVIRAEAAAADKMAALDLAVDKMAAQMRRAADRRLTKRRRSSQPVVEVVPEEPESTGHEAVSVEGEGPMIVREKKHEATPMSLDQALYEMELVGHDFYLFVDKESHRPSVVYRRRGYDYGVITLDVS